MDAKCRARGKGDFHSSFRLPIYQPANLFFPPSFYTTFRFWKTWVLSCLILFSHLFPNLYLFCKPPFYLLFRFVSPNPQLELTTWVWHFGPTQPPHHKIARAMPASELIYNSSFPSSRFITSIYSSCSCLISGCSDRRPLPEANISAPKPVLFPKRRSTPFLLKPKYLCTKK